MRKAIIYGTGKYFFSHKHLLPKDIDIIAYADSDEKKATSHTGIPFEGKEMLAPSMIGEKEFDLLYICTDYPLAHEIFNDLKSYNIDLSKIRFLYRIDSMYEWSYVIQEDRSLISTIDGIKINEKSLTDSDILTEVFAMGSYDVHLPEEDSIFIDVGMNVGIVSLYFARYEWVSKIYGFEPFPDTYNQALYNFSLNDAAVRDKISPFNVALFDKDEDMEVSVNAEEFGWRSIMCQRRGGERRVKIVSRKASTEIKKIITENPGKRIILKIDVEGSEFPIFESLKETDVLSNIDVIMLEYHKMPEPINEILSSYGFKFFVIGRWNFGMIFAVK